MMIITNNNKLYIHFDTIIKKANVIIKNEKNIKQEQDIINTEFKIIELPKNSKTILLTIKIGTKTTNKRINIK